MTTRLTPKQPSEAFAVSFDFTALLYGETIASAILSATDPDGIDVTDTILDGTKQSLSDALVYGWVQAGESGYDYLLTCRVVSSGGATYELDAILPVIADPDTSVVSAGMVAGPIIEPVTLAELKLHLRIDHSEEDALLAELLQSAREYIEDYTRRALLTQTWDYALTAWPDERYIRLPGGNLQGVSSIKYKDSTGAETIFPRSSYFIEGGEGIGRVVLAPNQSWPSVSLYPGRSIIIRYVCGWTSAAAVPAKIQSAIKMHAAKLYESRGEDVIGQTVTEDKVVPRLLASSRLYEEF